MNLIKKIIVSFLFATLFLTQTAFSQVQPTHEMVAYTLATVLSEDFNVVETTSEQSKTMVHMVGNYITEQTAKTLVIERIVRRYSDVRIVYPWSYYDVYLATVLHIDGMDNYEIILLINSQGNTCHLFIGVNDKHTKL